MKKLNIKAFWLILSGLVLALIFRIISLLSLESYDLYEFVNTGTLTQTQIDEIKELVFQVNIFVAVMSGVLLIYFIYLLVNNTKKEIKQDYISFLYVVYIVFLIFKVLSLFLGDLVMVIGILSNAAVIAGCKIQRDYVYNDEK